MVTPKSVRLKNSPEGAYVEKFAPNLTIARIVYGIVRGDGEYLLRVHDDGVNTKYLVRYEIEEEVRFQVVDFHDQEVLQ
jgi:hypothetical protein